MPFTPDQLAVRRVARATCDQLLTELRRLPCGLGQNARTTRQHEADLSRRLAGQYEIVAETSSAPEYERGEARRLRAHAEELERQIGEAGAASARPW